MDTQIQLKQAEIIIENVSTCIYCGTCRELALQYFSLIEYQEQLEREDGEAKGKASNL